MFLDVLFLFLTQQCQTLFDSQVGVNVFERCGGIEAEMAFAAGKRLGDRFEHRRRADPRKGCGTLVVKQVSRLVHFGDQQRDGRLQMASPANRTANGSSHFIGSWLKSSTFKDSRVWTFSSTALPKRANASTMRLA